MYPECKNCSKKRASDYQHDYWDEYYEVQNKRKYANIEAWRAYHRAHNHIRKDLHTERLIRFYDNHPEKIKEYSDKHKQKEHKISKKEWLSCKLYFENMCAYCGLPLSEHYYTRKGIKKLGDFHREHKDSEGANDLSNCIPACGSCNSSKHSSTFEEWYIPNNPIFSQDRLDIINKWLNEGYKEYIKDNPPYIIIKRKNTYNNKFHHELWSLDAQCKMINMISNKEKRKDLEQDVKNYLLSISYKGGGNNEYIAH